MAGASEGVDVARIEAAVVEMLAAIGEDPTRAGLQDTPRRVAEAWREYFRGVGVDPVEQLRATNDIDLEPDRLGEVVLVRDLRFRSVCEHHLLPFTGVAHIAYVPGERVVGLGALPRVLDVVASRPQVQERLTELVADALAEGLGARGVLVVLDAVHACVTARGPQQTASSTVTVASRGSLADPVQRAEIMALIGAPGRAAS